MPSVTIQNLGNKTLEVQKSVQPLLLAFAEAGVDWMHACGGKGRCTTCMMQVLSGEEQLSPLSAAEQQMKRLGRLPDAHRLACQCRIETDQTVVVRVPDFNKLPHLLYTE